MGAQLDDQVRAWLETEGYPLEYRVARELRKAGFRTQQGRSYTDGTGDGKTREIDVLAEVRAADRSAWVAIECKAARLPWVVLLQEDRAPEWEPIVVTQDWSFTERVRQSFVIGPRFGFALLQALKKSDQDPGFAVLSQATSAARGILEARDRPGFSIPVVVISSPLLSMFVDDVGEESLQRCSWQRLVWHGSRYGRTLVDVVTVDGLSDYATRLRAELDVALANSRELDSPIWSSEVEYRVEDHEPWATGSDHAPADKIDPS